MNCLNCRHQPAWGEWSHWDDGKSRVGVCKLVKMTCTHRSDNTTTPKACPSWDNPLVSQVGGSHYEKLGDYQPYIVCRKWFTDEEFLGAIKKDVISYLCRERSKNQLEDYKKALHTLAIGICLFEDMKGLE